MRRLAPAMSLVVILVSAAAAPARSLNGLHATMQFNGTAHTAWSFPPTAPVDDGCFIRTDSGSGSQTYDYAMHRKSDHLRLVDSGGSVSFQMPQGERLASQIHSLPGFGRAGADRIGNIKTVYSKGLHWDAFECGPVPQEDFADTSGCGGYHVPWDATPIDIAGRLYPELAAYPPTDMLTQCPFYGPSVIGFPTSTATHLPLSELRSVLSRRHGKLIIHGHDRSHLEEMQGRYDLTITTTTSWSMILTRVR